MKPVMWMIRFAQLALHLLGPQMALLMLPGGYVIALAGWLRRR